MGLVTPDYGTIFWMVLAFSAVFFALRKYAWGPILKGLKNREESIDEALKSADKARDEMAKLQADNEVVMKQARADRDTLLTEAREIRDSMIDQARNDASAEAEKVMNKAKQQLENEKLAAISDIQKQVSELSVEIAEKILRKELKDPKSHEEMIQDMLKNLKLN